MAFRVDLDKAILRETLEFAIAQRKRARNTSKRPEFTAIYEKEEAMLNHAIQTLQEVK